MTAETRKESIPIVVTEDVPDISGSGGNKFSRKTSIKPPGGRRKSVMKLSGISALPGRRLTKALLDLPEEQNSLAAAKPKIRMENTYKMAPDEDSTFLPWKVQNTVKDIFQEQLKGVSYDDKTASKLCCDLAQIIRNKVRNMEFPRYKIICNVIIGQCSEQGLEVASRCLWDSKSDNYACIEYKNHSLFAIAMVHGIFFE